MSKLLSNLLGIKPPVNINKGPTPNISGNDGATVFYLNDRFIAVFSQLTTNQAAYSYDGIHWTSFTLPISTDWYSAVYANGKYIFNSRQSAYFAHTTDLVNWTIGTKPYTAETSVFRFIQYLNGLYMLFTGSDGFAPARTGFYYSSDLITWTRADYGGDSVYCVAYGNGKYVAIDAMSTGIYTSTDLVTWTKQTAPFSGRWIIFNNGRFHAVNRSGRQAAYSTDGITWTKVTFSSNPMYAYERLVAINNVLYILPGSANTVSLPIYYSTDNGATWSNKALPQFSFDCWNLAYGNGVFVFATGYGGVLVSSDGINYTPYPLPFVSSAFSFAYGNGMYVALGDGSYAAYSTDGVTWNNKFIPEYATTIPVIWNKITYANGYFVAVPQNPNTGYILVSSNGIDWVRVNPAPTGTAVITDVVFINGTWAVLTNGNTATTGSVVYFATNPLGSWVVTIVSATKYNLRGIAYGNGIYVITYAGAGTGNLWSSNWGVTWSAGATAYDAPWVGFFKNQFYRMTATGLIYSSVDGSNWTQITSATWPNAAYAGVVVTDDAILFFQTGSYKNIMYSTDGVTFNKLAASTNSRGGVVIESEIFFLGIDSNGLRYLCNFDLGDL